MSSEGFSISNTTLPYDSDLSVMRVGIVLTEWNADITESLLDGARTTLLELGVQESNITVMRVPGAFELVYGCAKYMRERYCDVIIALGCVIKGDTPHFDYICSAATQGLTELNLDAKIPVINGVLTTLTKEQAIARTTGELGNKGKEFALTAAKMFDFSLELQN